MFHTEQKEIKFLQALQSFTVHCVAHRSSAKTKSNCQTLLSAIQSLPRLYIGHKVQIALALQSACQRNESRLTLNESMYILSHLIKLCRTDEENNENDKCHQWTGIDLSTLLDQCEALFKQQCYSSTLWIEVLNENSLVSSDLNPFHQNLFDTVQHDADIEQFFQWLNGSTIQIPSRLNRTYRGVPLFWCTPSFPSPTESKYGSLRLTFPWALVYSPTRHHLFDLGTRKSCSHVWHNMLITTRKQIVGYGTIFPELSHPPSLPLDMAIDLSDGPLVLSDVRITFVDHTQHCVPLLPTKLTRDHQCYHTSNTAMQAFLLHLHKKENAERSLDLLKHLFNPHDFEKLKNCNENLSEKSNKSEV